MEAAGLASSILTFIDVSWKIAKGVHEIYTSVSGATAENAHIAGVISDLQNASSKLSVHLPGQVDAELNRLSTQCGKLAEDLLALLRRLQARDKNLLRSFSAAVRGARKQKDVASIEKRLDKYRQQILLRLTVVICQNQSPILKHLEEIRKDSDRLKNERALELDNLHLRLSEMIQAFDSQHGPATNAKAQPEHDTHRSPVAQSSIVQDDEQSQLATETHSNRKNSQESVNMGMTTGLDKLAALLNDFKSLCGTMQKDNIVFRALYFEAIYLREHNVQDPAAETFSWMLEDPEFQNQLCEAQSGTSDGNFPVDTDFDDKDDESANAGEQTFAELQGNGQEMWETRSLNEDLEQELEKRRKTSEAFASFLKLEGDTFFICGKAGSGKSTLMKYLAHHERVKSALSAWANGRKLVHVNMFFWKSGDPLQTSLEGFYRTILFHTLRQCPELISHVFPSLTDFDMFGSVRVPLARLQQAWNRLIRATTTTSHAFCYFIDGLDEYEGDTADQKQLAEKLFQWAHAGNLKIACSARPYPIFLHIFQTGSAIVHLHDLTLHDIRDFAKTQFEEQLKEPIFSEARRACLGMIKKIQRKAEGVFLWAILVVRSLLNGALEHEDEKSLRERLEECPTDLNGLFRQMLKNANTLPSAKHRTNLILDLVVHIYYMHVGYINPLVISWLPEFNWFQSHSDFPCSQTSQEYTEGEIADRLDKVQKQLQFWTGGILEVVHIPRYREYTLKSLYFIHSLTFFHRSVRDFLQDDWLPKLKDQPFKSAQHRADAICRVKVAELKFAPKNAVFRIHKAFKVFFTIVKRFDRNGFQDMRRHVEDLEKSVCGDQQTVDSHFATLPLIKGVKAICCSHDMPAAISHVIGYFGDGLRQEASFIHLAAFYDATQYVQDRLSTTKHPSAPDPTDISLLLSAALGRSKELIKYFLQRGQHPNNCIVVQQGQGLPTTLVSVWEVFFLWSFDWFYTHGRKGSLSEELKRPFAVAECLIEAGADLNCKIIVKDLRDRDDDENIADATAKYCIDLSQMVAIARPSNQAKLDKLISGSVRSKRLQRLWDRTRFSSARSSPRFVAYSTLDAEQLGYGEWVADGLYWPKEDRTVGRFWYREY